MSAASKKRKKYLKTAQAAKRVHRQVSTLETWRRERRGPPFIRVMGQVLYDEEALDDWLAQQQVEFPHDTVG